MARQAPNIQCRIQSVVFPLLDVGRLALDVFWLQTELVELIRAEIAKRGQVSFAWFMEQALYHPEHGYYASGRAAIGRRGDYFTSVSVGPLFGQLLAAQFGQIWQRLGQIDNFIIAEQGAQDGDFARDVLGAIRNLQPTFFEALRYWIVEPFAVLQDRQLKTLGQFADRVEWRRSPPDLEPFTGIHFSNELLDAMPVHLLASTGDGWREKFVAFEGDKFVLGDQPIVDPTLQAFVKRLPARPAGYETEVNLAALDWLGNVSAKLERGHVLAFDYGFSRDEFYAPYRTAGTLQVREKHRQLPSPFEQIGQADITAHVNWTALAERAESHGLRIAGFTDQHHFITGIISEMPELSEEPKAKRALQTLLHPEMLGRAFQVLALTKGAGPGAPLSGFKFARDPRAALGI